MSCLSQKVQNFCLSSLSKQTCRMYVSPDEHMEKKEEEAMESMDKEVVINGKSREELPVTESECEPQCSVIEKAPSEAAQTESLSDWFVVVCVFLCNILVGFNIACYGVLYLPITEIFQSSRAAVGWIVSFDAALASFLGIFFSYPVSVFGCRRPATVGGLLIAIGGILSCFSPSLMWMYLLKGIIPGIGQSLMLLSCNVIIQQRCNKHRSLATGISIMGYSVGHFIGGPLTQLLLDCYGLCGTLALLGAIQSHRIPLALQFRSPERFKTTTKDTRLTDSDKRTKCDKLKGYIKGSLDFTLLKKATLLLFCIQGILQKFVVNCYVPHTVNWALAAGVSQNLAVWAASTLSCATTLCRIIVSLTADRQCVNRLIVYASGLLFAFLMCIPPLVFPGVVGSYCSVVLFGLHAGCVHTLAAVVLVDLQGVELFARCFALYSVFTSFSLLTGSPFMGLMYDLTGSYNVGFITLSCVALAALSLIVTIYILQRKQQPLPPLANTKC